MNQDRLNEIENRHDGKDSYGDIRELIEEIERLWREYNDLPDITVGHIMETAKKFEKQFPIHSHVDFLDFSTGKILGSS